MTTPTSGNAHVALALPRLLPPLDLDKTGSLTWTTTLSQSIQSAVGALATYKLRAALTLVGILVGVAGLLVIDAFGQINRVAESSMFNTATLINIAYAAPTSGGVFSGTGQSTLTAQDVQAVERVPHATEVSPVTAGRLQLVAGSNNWNSMAWGGGPALASLQNLSIKEGRFYTQQEDASGAMVVVLSDRAASGLFPGADALGQKVRIGSLDYNIVGVLKPQGFSPAGHDMDEIVYVPLGGSQQRLFGQPIGSIALRADATANVPAVMAAITQTLGQNHHLAAGQAADFSVRDFQQTRDEAEQAGATMGRMMSVVAGVALLIGGVGIANVMLAAVAARSREIGIRLAVGARQRDVLLQFVVEAVTLSLVGGVLGVALGFGLWWLAGRGMPILGGFGVWPSATGIFTALGATLLLGLGFGFYPARRAARLDPVDALRRV